jgi:hypothetical protein
MSTFLQQYELWNSGTLRTRIRVACMQVAFKILSAEKPEDKDYAPRLVWAKEAFAQEATVSGELVWAVVLDSSVTEKIGEGFEAEAAQALITDEEIQAIVDKSVEGLMKRYG